MKFKNFIVKYPIQKWENATSFDINNYIAKINNNSLLIPKLIMQTWKNYDIPDKWKESPKSIETMMPDWEYILMTDKDIDFMIDEYFPWFRRTANKFQYGIQKADSMRYMFLYLWGGIYMDLDFIVEIPLDSLFCEVNSNLYFTTNNDIVRCVTNCFMASKPGQKFWLDLLKDIQLTMDNPEWYMIGRHFTVMMTAGPMALQRALKKNTCLYTIIPPKLIMPCSICEKPCNATGSYLQPLEGCSWISWDTMIYNYSMCNWRKIAFWIFLIIFLILLALFLYFFNITI